MFASCVTIKAYFPTTESRDMLVHLQHRKPFQVLLTINRLLISTLGGTRWSQKLLGRYCTLDSLKPVMNGGHSRNSSVSYFQVAQPQI